MATVTFRPTVTFSARAYELDEQGAVTVGVQLCEPHLGDLQVPVMFGSLETHVAIPFGQTNGLVRLRLGALVEQ